ncbi:MAG: response regulator transcription factor [Eubacteriaceae bacterium]|nr:response regulator transcription factor [Eubacteriaceae bacterium]
MDITICLSNEDETKKLQDKLKTLGKKYSIYVNTDVCSNTESLMFHSDDDPNKKDLVIVDTQLTGEDGIEVATKLRDKGYENELIFLTKEKGKVFDSFNAEPLNYILEDELDKRLEDTFVRADKKMQRRREDMISLSCAGETRNVNLRDIYYFHSEGKLLDMHYSGERTFQFYSPIKKIEELLFAKGFVRIHRSYLVSETKIKKVSYETVEMINGDTLPVGRAFYKALKSKMREDV